MWQKAHQRGGELESRQQKEVLDASGTPQEITAAELVVVQRHRSITGLDFQSDSEQDEEGFWVTLPVVWRSTEAADVLHDLDKSQDGIGKRAKGKQKVPRLKRPPQESKDEQEIDESAAAAAAAPAATAAAASSAAPAAAASGASVALRSTGSGEN